MRPIFFCLIIFFIIISWPFIGYPFTDGDITHWVGIAREISQQNNFLTSPHDQAHGPLLMWATGAIVKLSPHTFYLYNFWNILMALVGVWVTYLFALNVWKKENIAQLSAVIISTCLMYVYIARTPMYDLTSAVGYVGFCVFYFFYIQKNKTSDLCYALAFLVIGSLSRFSTVIILAGIYMTGVSYIYKRSFFAWMRDGFLLITIPLLCNLPWIIAQTQTHGQQFLSVFIYDNIGRYIKEPPANAVVRRDYYGFFIYILLGMIPYTFFLVASFFQKPMWRRLIKDKTYQVLFFGFVPCFLFFSFSGHVKLARYIIYVFPFISLLLAHSMIMFDLKNTSWRKQCNRLAIGTLIFLGLIFALLLKQFTSQAQEGMALVIGLILLLFLSVFFVWFMFRNNYSVFIKKPLSLLMPLAVLYIIFFSIVTYESFHASFLVDIRHGIERSIH